MRGQLERNGSLFSYMSIEERIPASFPLQRIRQLSDQALDRLNPTFCALFVAEDSPRNSCWPHCYKRSKASAERLLHRQIHSQFLGKRKFPIVTNDHEVSQGRDVTWTLRAKSAPAGSWR